mmetsp:Transcript_18587/g.62307  ORF Transcript_18587/g.62307 Transcript_18587/m.62307 type:complete len:135 (+) Transcript_18587:40-444(+)
MSGWTQQWSPEHKRDFYHNPATGESVWDQPQDGSPIRFLENIDELRKTAGLASGSRPAPMPTAMLASLLLPIALVLLGLFLLHLYVAKYHPELLQESAKKRRDRAQLRRKEKASKYRAKWKMSQDGKGGRSANS